MKYTKSHFFSWERGNEKEGRGKTASVLKRGVRENMKIQWKNKHEVITYSQVQVDNLPGLPMTQHKNQTFSEAKIKYSLDGTPFALVFLNLEVFHSNICKYRQLWVDKLSTGNWTWSCTRVANALNNWASSILKYYFLQCRWKWKKD